MNKKFWYSLIFFSSGSVLILGGTLSFTLSARAAAGPDIAPTATKSPIDRQAWEDAYLEWEQSEHADTFDNGLGANTTCARCKSPKNWDPSQEVAALEALDCGSCKRVPGAPRPELESGSPVSLDDWQDITCEICHIQEGDSVTAEIAFWDQTSGTYQDVESVNELCAHCHEGRHGFEVVEEQRASPAHQNWDCTKCHGNHGKSSSCTDCHNPAEGSGASEHARHPSVNCTGCHDNGRLSVWQEMDPQSDFFGSFITRRFAHALTSWPSHNLSKEVDCVRCHHPAGEYSRVLVEEVSCQECHEEGAVLFWCEYFPRDEAVDPQQYPTP